MTDRPQVYIIDGYNLMAAMEGAAAKPRRGRAKGAPEKRRAADKHTIGPEPPPAPSEGGELPLEERRERLLERLTDFAARAGVRMHVVFDGRKGGGPEMNLPGVHVTFSEKPHGADQVIERLARELSRTAPVHVVTGDYLQQRLIFRENVYRKPPREMLEEMVARRRTPGRRGGSITSKTRYRLGDRLPGAVRDELERLRRDEREDK